MDSIRFEKVEIIFGRKKRKIYKKKRHSIRLMDRSNKTDFLECLDVKNINQKFVVILLVCLLEQLE